MENKLIHNIPASYAERDELRNRIQAFVDDLTNPAPTVLGRFVELRGSIDS